MSSNTAKRIDVAVAADDSFLFLSKRLGHTRDFEAVYLLSESASYVAFTKAKGNQGKSLADKFNKTLRQLKKEGFIQKVSDKYTK